MESRLPAHRGGWWWGWVVAGSRIKEKEFRDQDKSMVIAGGRGSVEVEEGIRGINGNGKIK